MNTVEKKSTSTRASDSPYSGSQQDLNPYKKQYDTKKNQNRQDEDTNQSRDERQNQSRRNGPRDIDAQRHPEEQIVQPIQDEQGYNDRIDRI